MHRPCMEFFNSNAHTHKNYIPKISLSVLYCTAWLVYYLYYFLLSWAASVSRWAGLVKSMVYFLSILIHCILSI